MLNYKMIKNFLHFRLKKKKKKIEVTNEEWGKIGLRNIKFYF